MKRCSSHKINRFIALRLVPLKSKDRSTINTANTATCNSYFLQGEIKFNGGSNQKYKVYAL